MNPNYKAGSTDWKQKRKHITYTSSALTTQGKKSFGLGVFEMRGKIDVREGSWPAWWTLGANIKEAGWNWPRAGEIDMMEGFGKAPWARGPELKANVIWGTSGRWDYKLHRYFPGKDVHASESTAVDAKWGSQWHVWKMERTATHIKLYCDGKLLNNFNINIDQKAKETFAADKKIFMLVNLALGGCCGGNPDTNKGAPFKFEVDYIRVYE